MRRGRDQMPFNVAQEDPIGDTSGDSEDSCQRWHNVYARIFWMFWPDELLKGTRDGKEV